MDLSQISIVLCRPEESRNIGAVCRAMANSGLSKLRIVGNKDDYDDERVRILAIHSVAIWENAEFFSNIKDACKDCSFIAGTTRRKGKKRKDTLLLPEDLAERVVSIPRAAIVFGNERTGLTDIELDECTMGVTIPSHEDFGSLNLSHAVQIICYSLFRVAQKKSPGMSPVDLYRLDKTIFTITENLQKIGFFHIAGRKDMEAFWRSVLSRASLSEGECQYIEKIFNKITGLSQKIFLKTNIGFIYYIIC